MKLYQANSSPNSRRVRIYLAEKGISMPIVPVDLAAKEQFSEPYAEINPRRVVPTLLLDDGTAIGEVPAILRYLEEIHPAPPLLGSTAKAKALVTMWERRVEQEGFASAMEAVRNAVPGLKGRAIAGPHDYEQIPALVERSKARVGNFYADFNARLAEVSFIAGDEFSVADITAIVTVDFATRAVGLAMPEELTALRRWYDDVSARPSMAA
ncbi:glutathione S-transferase family protein [Bradyrhizobium erythrophlei]|uniref:Glutathione S-transferase n=1 Tax=Bradyrhizobium erythrophlei TaxID=1437360 RepID=A0A1M5GTX0_9BRAD|nr:glutathione S-transferase [Bradyrhizobium erythrophlei]SHG07123.1 glutathione S-transferase [Bradyrhizobium erythrophlei]